MTPIESRNVVSGDVKLASAESPYRDSSLDQNRDSGRAPSTSPSEPSGRTSILHGSEMASLRKADAAEPSVSIGGSVPVSSAETNDLSGIILTATPQTTRQETFLLFADDATCSTTDASTPSGNSPSRIFPPPALPAGVKPYYEHNGIAIILGDCREVLPTLGLVDCVITDPPYQSLDANVLAGTTTRLVPRNGKRLSKDDSGWFDTLDPVAVCAVLDMCRRLLRSDGALYVFADVKSGLVLFPGWARNVIVWDKGSIGMGYAWRRMHEWIAYEPMPNHKLRDQSLGDIIRVSGVNVKAHPTEKPLGVVVPLIKNSTDVGAVILDPFAGSGSTLEAAKSMGRKAIGIEIEERYCEIAAKRLAQEVLPLECA